MDKKSRYEKWLKICSCVLVGMSLCLMLSILVAGLYSTLNMAIAAVGLILCFTILVLINRIESEIVKSLMDNMEHDVKEWMKTR